MYIISLRSCPLLRNPSLYEVRMYFDREEPVDPLIDELLQKASKERDHAKFWKLIREANRLLAARRSQKADPGQEPLRGRERPSPPR